MGGNEFQPGVRKARRNVQARLRIRLGPREWWSDIADLSLSGVRATPVPDLPVETGQSVAIELLCEDVPAVSVEGQCVRAGQGELAFRFPQLDKALESELRCVMRRCGAQPEGTE